MPNIKRKKLWIGKQIQVCGEPVSKRHNLVCLLPATVAHSVHTSMAINDKNVIVIAQRDTNPTNNPNGETTWVEAHG